MVKKLAIEAERFSRACLRDDRSRGHWVAFVGQTGTGKTMVAKAIHAYVGSRQILAWSVGWLPDTRLSAPVYLDWPMLCRKDSSVFDARLDEFVGAHLVVIDDLGAESEKFKNGESQERLLEVLQQSKDKWLIVTTNVLPIRWREVFGQRCADRLLAGNHVDLSGVPSYRMRT